MNTGRLLGVLLSILASACHTPLANGDRTAKPKLPRAVEHAQNLLQDIGSRAKQRGAGELIALSHGLGAEGDRHGTFIDLDGLNCALIVAKGTEGIGDLDLFVFRDDGSLLASDESSADAGVLMLCPPLPDRVYLSARIATGSGLISLGHAPVERDKATAVARGTGARFQGEETGRLESWPGLESKVVARRRLLGSSWEDVRRFAAPVDPRAATRTTVPIEAGRCLDVLVVPSEEVGSLEVLIETEEGRIATRAKPEGRDRATVLCSEFGENVTIAARPRGSSGMAAFVLARSSKGAATELKNRIAIDRISAEVSADEAATLLAKELAPQWGAGKRGPVGDARVGRKTSNTLTLAQGCQRIDVVAGKPLGPVASLAFLADGTLVADQSGSLGASLYSCGATRELRVDVESRGRPGPFALLTHSWNAPPAPFLQAPIAAGRLLDRGIGRSSLDPKTLQTAQLVALQADKLFRSSFVVPPNACREVIVALDSTGHGIDLRLVDLSGKTDALMRGSKTATQRMCAEDTPRQIQAEILLDQGPAPALMLVREPPE